MDELLLRVTNEIDSLSQKLMGRIKELSERYAEPLPETLIEAEELSKKVETHLINMGFNWE
jgi:type I restriction enzyme M protein